MTLREAVMQNAHAHASDIAPMIEAIRAQDHISLRAIAPELNARGILTRRSGRWRLSSVNNLLTRIEANGIN